MSLPEPFPGGHGCRLRPQRYRLNAFRKLLADPELHRRMGPARPQEAPAGVTLDRMLRETEKVYEEVVGDGG